MLFARKRTSARGAGVLLAVGLSALGVGLGSAAQADPVTATYQQVESATTSQIDLTANSHHQGGGEAGTGIIDLQSGGQTLRTYCINLEQQIAGGHPAYQEQDWSSWAWATPTAPASINWILHHSYPSVTVADVIAAAGGTSTGKADQDLRDVVAGTQAAIWHYSDGTGLAGPDANNDALKIAVYTYLTSSANTGESEPAPSLSLSPASVAVQDDNTPADTPITVTTSATAVKLDYTAPSGVTLTDNGKPAGTTAKNGDELNLTVAPGTKPGSFSLTATASGQVPVGRIFKGTKAGTQTVILAGSQNVSLTASATFSWSHQAAPAPSVSFSENCSSKSVDVTLSNNGDAAATFTVGGKTYTVAAGASPVSVSVPVAASGDYDVTVTSGSKNWHQSGHLNCAVVSPTQSPSGGPTTTGSAPSVGPANNSSSLASTGSGNVPMLAGIGAAVIVVGAGLVFFLRRRAITAGRGGHS